MMVETQGQAIVAGLIAGGGYFLIGERGIPKDSNCSYLSPAITDYLAWTAGAFLAWRGSELGDPIVTMIGVAVASLHLAQWGAHKVQFDRIEAPA